MNIQEYIDSGILEAYVLGSVTDAEAKELLTLKKQYPEINAALQELEFDLEHMARQMAIQPPPGAWDKINDNIHGLIPRPEVETELFRERERSRREYRPANDNQYIEVEATGNQMRIHKAWRWVFAAVFILGKIFLGFAIYFYLENRQSEKQIQQLQEEIRLLKK